MTHLVSTREFQQNHPALQKKFSGKFFSSLFSGSKFRGMFPVIPSVVCVTCFLCTLRIRNSVRSFDFSSSHVIITARSRSTLPFLLLLRVPPVERGLHELLRSGDSDKAGFTGTLCLLHRRLQRIRLCYHVARRRRDHRRGSNDIFCTGPTFSVPPVFYHLVTLMNIANPRVNSYLYVLY